MDEHLQPEDIQLPSKKDVAKINKQEKEAIRKVIEDALKEHVDEANIKYNAKLDIDNALLASIGEFLGSYIIIGYDLTGEPLQMSYSKTPQESNALDALLMKFVPTYFAHHNIGNDWSDM